MTAPDFVVLRRVVHGMDSADYATELERRVPDSFEVSVAETPGDERRMLETARVVTGLDGDDVLITPHNAGHTPKYWHRLADIVADNATRLDGGQFRNRVVCRVGNC